jgi:hypothetical protein
MGLKTSNPIDLTFNLAGINIPSSSGTIAIEGLQVTIKGDVNVDVDLDSLNAVFKYYTEVRKDFSNAGPWLKGLITDVAKGLSEAHEMIESESLRSSERRFTSHRDRDLKDAEIRHQRKMVEIVTDKEEKIAEIDATAEVKAKVKSAVSSSDK